MDKLLAARENFREQWAWLLLPLLFAICFILPNSTGATNLYRLFIVLPILLCFRPEDIKDIWANVPARWFLLLCGWMTVTLLWDGWGDKDIKLLLRELNTLALFYLVFLVGKFHSDRLSQIIDWFLVFGFLGALLILKDWQGAQYVEVSWQHMESARGVFSHHLEVGWMMAILAIVALFNGLRSIKPSRNALYFLVFLFFAVVTLWVQARGAYVVIAVGVLLMLLLVPGKNTRLLAVLSSAGFVLTAILFQQELLVIAEKITTRGTAGRLPIWQNGIAAILESSATLLFGHGLSESASNQVGNYSAAHYHNFFLNHVFYSGLVGLVLYFGLLFNVIKKATAQPSLWVFAIILLAMQFGFITDGDGFFENPSSTLLCLLLPMAIVIFVKLEQKQLKSALIGRHISLVILCGLFVSGAFFALVSNKVNSTFNGLLPEEGKGLKAVVILVPETGVLTVNIEGWPEFFGAQMPVLVAGVERPFPWRYKCEQAKALWQEGREHLALLSKTSPEVELRNIRREKAKHIFRLEADVYMEGENLANKLIAAGFMLPKGNEIRWCKD